MRASTRALAAELRSALEAAGDPQRAVQQQAYMKSEMPFAGVATPGLRKIAREVFSAHPQPSPVQWKDSCVITRNSLVAFCWTGAAMQTYGDDAALSLRS